MSMFGNRTRALSPRPPAEARTAIVVIVLISSLAFLLFQARKDALDNLLLHQASLAIQLATAEAHAGPSDTVTLIDNDARRPNNPLAGIATWPGQKTIAIPLASGCADSPLCHG